MFYQSFLNPDTVFRSYIDYTTKLLEIQHIRKCVCAHVAVLCLSMTSRYSNGGAALHANQFSRVCCAKDITYGNGF